MPVKLNIRPIKKLHCLNLHYTSTEVNKYAKYATKFAVSAANQHDVTSPRLCMTNQRLM